MNNLIKYMYCLNVGDKVGDFKNDLNIYIKYVNNNRLAATLKLGFKDVGGLKVRDVNDTIEKLHYYLTHQQECENRARTRWEKIGSVAGTDEKW